MKLFRVDNEYGYTLIEARDIRSARVDVRREYGEQAVVRREATQDDIEWYKAMCSYPPGLGVSVTHPGAE